MPPAPSSMEKTEAMPSLPEPIRACIETWPIPAQQRFGEVRDTVLEAARRADVGEVTESLKWGQPSWLPATPRIGSTLRCDWHAEAPDRLSIYVHCQTTLVETLRMIYPDAFTYEGNRALHMALDQPVPQQAVDHCAFLTLTYHRKTT